jgi:hypothetical protein
LDYHVLVAQLQARHTMASNSKGEKRAEYLANVMMDAGELQDGATDLQTASVKVEKVHVVLSN